MTREALHEFYTRGKTEIDAQRRVVKRKINLVSNTRLATALVFIAVLYVGFDAHQWLYALVPLVAIFAALVKWHARLFERKIHLGHLSAIHEEERNALNGEISKNPSGAEFVDVHHAYSHDLDIFGSGSLFQSVNRCRTRGGMEKMATRLREKPQLQEQIPIWQEAARELAAMPEFRHHVQALSRQLGEEADDRHEIKQWLAHPPFLPNKSLIAVLLIALPVITVPLVVAAFLTKGFTGPALLAAGFQWIFLSFHLKRINLYHQYISGKKNALARYSHLLQAISAPQFSTPFMQSLQRKAGQGYEAVQRLASLVNAFDARLNAMTNLVVNSLLLYDLQCVYRLERWKEQHGVQLLQWLDTVYETEVMASMGTFAFNNPEFTFPDIVSERLLEAEALGHPLLHETERVTNDVRFDQHQSVMIITGANMAGKSTFLRSIGVNVVLALAGAPVCASKMRCPFIEIRSGMRTADSLQEHQSYFYAELDRLKSIMDELRTGKPLLILLDEILKGTNSNDKQAGSIALVKQLVDQPCLALIATHDLALGSLEDTYPERVLNYSFEPHIENDQLFFDYKLRRGIAQQMNATFLMKKMGILPGG